MGQIQRKPDDSSGLMQSSSASVTLPLEAVLIELENRILNLHRFASKRFDIFQRKLERSTDLEDEAKYGNLCDGYENALSVCDDAQRLITLLRKLK